MTIMSTLHCDSKELLENLQKMEITWPPAIPFVFRPSKKATKKGKKTGNNDLDGVRKFDISLDHNDPNADTYSKSVKVILRRQCQRVGEVAH
jgi:hypothetical protein